MACIKRKSSYYSSLALMICACHAACADEVRSRSTHIGFLYPNGVDVLGYSIEDKLGDHLYQYYTFGYPALASIGISYYANYTGNGLSASIGTGIGYLNQANGSIAYQWQLPPDKESCFVKFGIGYAESLVFSGAFPVLSLEKRWQ